MRTTTALVRAAAMVLIVTAAVATVGVASHDASAGTDPKALDLPPFERDDIAKLFEDQLAALGLRTTRALLQDRGSYQPSPRGTHLALYVEPIDPADADAASRIDAIVPLARVFLPKVFRRWSDLESFDVCQESAATMTAGTVPPPVTQLALVRKAAARIDWANADLADLVTRAAKANPKSPEGWGDPRRFYLYVGPEARDVPAYRQARRGAGLAATVPVPTAPVTPSS